MPGVIIRTAVAIAALLAANSVVAMRGKMQGDTYVSPDGEISCKVAHYDLGEVKVKDAYDKRAGTISFLDFFDITRIDFERFVEVMDPASLSEERFERAYVSYFDNRLEPLVRSGVRNAIVVSRKFVPGTKPIYVSVMGLPSKDGDQVRGAVEYTDGHTMYVISVAHPMRPELGLTLEREADDVLKGAIAAFEHCQFRLSGSAGKGR
jgi:hypothetical protein